MTGIRKDCMDIRDRIRRLQATTAGTLVHHGQDAQGGAIQASVFDEVVGPDVIGIRCVLW